MIFGCLNNSKLKERRKTPVYPRRVWSSCRGWHCKKKRWINYLRVAVFIACENYRFFSLLAAGDVSRGGTSATRRQIFHTYDVNLSGIQSLALIGQRSSYIVLAIVYEWQTKDKRLQRWNVNAMNICGIYSSLEEVFEFCWSSFEVEHNTLPKSTRKNDLLM